MKKLTLVMVAITAIILSSCGLDPTIAQDTIAMKIADDCMGASPVSAAPNLTSCAIDIASLMPKVSTASNFTITVPVTSPLGGTATITLDVVYDIFIDTNTYAMSYTYNMSGSAVYDNFGIHVDNDKTVYLTGTISETNNFSMSGSYPDFVMNGSMYANGTITVTGDWAGNLVMSADATYTGNGSSYSMNANFSANGRTWSTNFTETF